MRVLTWNLFHGRSVPDTRRSLLPEFTEAIAGWDWDVALLQEVPPWWPPALARASDARERTVLTSRNALLPLRRAIAERRPDLIKSNGGGANAILVRGAIAADARLRVRTWPERRVAHAVRTGGIWVANVHASTHPDARTLDDLTRAGAALARWAGDRPAVLGGDFNITRAAVPDYTDAGGHGIDRFLLRGPITVATPPRTLHRGPLSDHVPVVVEVVGSGA
jgi:endonuclease/exonuclease/phosphatase family metal-dependent hydrolase